MESSSHYLLRQWYAHFVGHVSDGDFWLTVQCPVEKSNDWIWHTARNIPLRFCNWGQAEDRNTVQDRCIVLHHLKSEFRKDIKQAIKRISRKLPHRNLPSHQSSWPQSWEVSSDPSGQSLNPSHKYLFPMQCRWFFSHWKNPWLHFSTSENDN